MTSYVSAATRARLLLRVWYCMDRNAANYSKSKPLSCREQCCSTEQIRNNVEFNKIAALRR